LDDLSYDDDDDDDDGIMQC